MSMLMAVARSAKPASGLNVIKNTHALHMRSLRKLICEGWEVESEPGNSRTRSETLRSLSGSCQTSVGCAFQNRSSRATSTRPKQEQQLHLGTKVVAKGNTPSQEMASLSCNSIKATPRGQGVRRRQHTNSRSDEFEARLMASLQLD